MIEKGFLRNQPAGQTKHQRIASTVSRTLLYLGMVVLIAALGYIFFNLKNSDAMIGMMIPFIVTGIGLIIVSQVIKRAYTKLRR